VDTTDFAFRNYSELNALIFLCDHRYLLRPDLMAQWGGGERVIEQWVASSILAKKLDTKVE
jgi:hypothetical protein